MSFLESTAASLDPFTSSLANYLELFRSDRLAPMESETIASLLSRSVGSQPKSPAVEEQQAESELAK